MPQHRRGQTHDVGLRPHQTHPSGQKGLDLMGSGMGLGITASKISTSPRPEVDKPKEVYVPILKSKEVHPPAKGKPKVERFRRKPSVHDYKSLDDVCKPEPVGKAKTQTVSETKEDEKQQTTFEGKNRPDEEGAHASVNAADAAQPSSDRSTENEHLTENRNDAPGEGNDDDEEDEEENISPEEAFRERVRDHAEELKFHFMFELDEVRPFIRCPANPIYITIWWL